MSYFILWNFPFSSFHQNSILLFLHNDFSLPHQTLQRRHSFILIHNQITLVCGCIRIGYDHKMLEREISLTNYKVPRQIEGQIK